MANEVIDEKRQLGEEGVVFKIFFEKVYNHVDWKVLDHVLEKKRFRGRWRSWIQGCLLFVTFVVLINECARGWVKASRGSRTG